MSFAYPLLLLVGLIGVAALFAQTRSRAAPFPSLELLRKIPPNLRVILRRPILDGLFLACAALLTFGAARPQRISHIEQPTEHRNVILAIDVSKSMAAEDFPANSGYASRMEGVKSVVSEYVRGRENDRLGLVVFGSHAYLQSPLTTDSGLVEKLVTDLEPGMAGDGTAIGDGIGLALKRLEDIKGESKAIILMTDGVNNAGQVAPAKAAMIAKDLGIKIHTIGIGSNRSAAPGFGMGGIIDMMTNQISAEFDEETLKGIASTTGGVYFNAESIEKLKDVYREIEALTQSEEKEPSRTIAEEIFPKATKLALLVSIVLLLSAASIFLKVP